MAPARRLTGRLLARLSAEDGMALPTAMVATTIALALAGAAVLSSVDVQQSSHRDSSSKSAIGVADAGANVALMRLSRESESLMTAPCLEGGTPSGGWCPPVTEEVGDGTWEYRISEAGAGCGEHDLCVVATGTAGEVSRRVMVTFDVSSGNVYNGTKEEQVNGVNGGGGSEGLVGLEEVKIENNSDARVNVGTNGNVHVQNNGNVCGDIRHGVGKTATIDNNGTQCEGYEITESNVTMPSVESFMPADLATNNSDYRLVKCTKTTEPRSPTGCQLDTYNDKWTGTIPWNATTRTISTSNNSSLTLGGGDYWVCKVELGNNSHLIMAEGAHVRIFFDTPEHCGLSSGAKQVFVGNNANIVATGYHPSEGIFAMFGFYLLGSTTTPTSVEWNNNSGTNEVMIYAPNTNILIQNNAEFFGVIAGKTITLNNNVVVTQDAGFELEPWLNPWSKGEPSSEVEPTPTPPVFTAQYYVECSGQAATVPSEGC